jgi:hypothetical protein
MAGAPRPSSTQNSGLPDILASAFDFAKTFAQYELNPQSLMQGNQFIGQITVGWKVAPTDLNYVRDILTVAARSISRK